MCELSVNEFRTLRPFQGQNTYKCLLEVSSTSQCLMVDVSEGAILYSLELGIDVNFKVISLIPRPPQSYYFFST